MKFLDKVILITGGSSGIGLELTRQFLYGGAIIAITGRNDERLKAAKQEFSIFGTRFLPIQADITSAINCKKVIEQVNYSFTRIDVLINNAGISAQCEIDDAQANVIDAVIDTNLKGAIYMTNYCMPYLIRTKGSVLFISSIASFVGLPEYGLYGASKAALTNFAQSLAIEAKRKKVFVGISYLSFTQNEDSKKALDAQGREIAIPKRNFLLTFSRERTAKLIIKQLSSRKKRQIHGVVGKCVRVISLFPFILRWAVYLKVSKNR